MPICRTGLQADAKGEAKAGSNAVAKARAWIENKGSLATFLAAAGIALVGQEVLKRTAGAVPRMVMSHHQGISATRLKMSTGCSPAHSSGKAHIPLIRRGISQNPRGHGAFFC